MVEYIDKFAALGDIAKQKEIHAPTTGGQKYKDIRLGFSIAMKVISNAPAVPVRRVIKAEWIMPTNGEDGRTYRCCTNCKENVLYAWLYDFCPHCGADMRKDEKNL